MKINNLIINKNIFYYLFTIIIIKNYMRLAKKAFIANIRRKKLK